MSQARDRTDPPRAVIHKLILDVAESRPSASMAEIADEVTGASTDMVEKVLTEYGDPGESADGPPPPEAATPDSPGDAAEDPDTDPDPEPMAQTESPTDSTGGANEEPDGQLAPDEEMPDHEALDQPITDEEPRPLSDDLELTEIQRKTLELIKERPEASQAELSEDLDVTGPTVSRWVNEIPEFDWDRRREIATTLLNGTMDTAATTPDSSALEDLRDRIESIERQLDAGGSSRLSLSPELAHKVMHACLHSDRITEDEELEILAAFMNIAGSD